MSFAVVCPGQGAQHAALFDRATGDANAEAAIAAAAQALGEDPRAWFAAGRDPFANAVAQPLICVAQLAQWTTLAPQVPAPAAFAGYSVGELAAHALAGAFDAAALATLARRRAECMDAAATVPGGLVAVRGLPRGRLAALCEGSDAWIAIAASSEAFVVGGTRTALDVLAPRVEAAGGTATPLPVGVAAHTPLLAAAQAPFRVALDAVDWTPHRAPVLAGIDAARIATRTQAVDTLCAQLVRTVEWTRVCDALHERGIRVVLELGPGRALSRGLRERFDDVEARAVEDFATLRAAAEWVRARLDAR